MPPPEVIDLTNSDDTDEEEEQEEQGQNKDQDADDQSHLDNDNEESSTGTSTGASARDSPPEVIDLANSDNEEEEQDKVQNEGHQDNQVLLLRVVERLAAIEERRTSMNASIERLAKLIERMLAEKY